jgi:hypothetical protein
MICYMCMCEMEKVEDEQKKRDILLGRYPFEDDIMNVINVYICPSCEYTDIEYDDE